MNRETGHTPRGLAAARTFLVLLLSAAVVGVAYLCCLAH
jgi:hypothetical protein